jgi:predicted AAA+ superfamily ATPase
MDNGFTFHWSMLLYLLAAIAYFEVMRRLDRYWAKRTPLTDEERLWNHARNQAISEHEVFKRAAATWTLGPQTADADFSDYLKTGTMPHYVRDYLRKLDRL